MKQEMLINVSQPEECRIAVVEDGVLEELYVERTSQDSFVGNIYKGVVVNLEPSIQAAFVDFGVGKNGFLHVSDLEPQYFKLGGVEPSSTVKRAGERPKIKPPIQDLLKRGDEVLVQVIKEGIGNKGPTLSTYISIPGRYLVLMPALGRVGVSRKIEDEAIRRKLRDTMLELEPPKGVGFIVRTAGIERTKRELARDLAYLLRLWKLLVSRVKKMKGPVDIYEESDIIIRTIRDNFSADVDAILIDSEDACKRAKEFLQQVMPRYANRVKLYEGKGPLFQKYNLENEIRKMYSRTVPVQGGGSIVIDQTEALVAIDVNSGSFRGDGDPEETAFQMNLRAAKEIARQIRLRDLGGVIVNDFIDLRREKNRRGVEKALRDAVRRDKARTKILRTSPFGLIEMTRQRIRPSLKKSIFTDCPVCKGTGLVKTPESLTIEAMRLLMIAAQSKTICSVDLTVAENVADYLNNNKRRELAKLEDEGEMTIRIHELHNAPPEHLQIICRDDNEREVPVAAK